MVAGSSEGFFAPDGKPMACRTVNDSFFEERKIAKPGFLALLERELAPKLGLAAGDLVITPPLLKRRFLPPNVHMATNNGPMHIKDYWPDQYGAWVAEARSYLKFHICVVPSERARVANMADQVVEMFGEAVGELLPTFQ